MVDLWEYRSQTEILMCINRSGTSSRSIPVKWPSRTARLPGTIRAWESNVFRKTRLVSCRFLFNLSFLNFQLAQDTFNMSPSGS